VSQLPPPPPPYGGPAYGGVPYGPPGYASGYGYVAPAGPAPGLRYGGFWIRFAAYLIDAALLNVPLYAVLFALFAPQLVHISCNNYSPIYGNGYFCSGTFTGFFWLGVVAVQVVHAVYFVLMWSLSGSTLGQKPFGLRVVDEKNGARISLRKGALRFLGYIVSGLVFNLGYMWAGWDPRKQGWHDKIAGTLVVRAI
jgi:uncharacterized RDD family membrane protein YckC